MERSARRSRLSPVNASSSRSDDIRRPSTSKIVSTLPTSQVRLRGHARRRILLSLRSQYRITLHWKGLTVGTVDRLHCSSAAVIRISTVHESLPYFILLLDLPGARLSEHSNAVSAMTSLCQCETLVLYPPWPSYAHANRPSIHTSSGSYAFVHQASESTGLAPLHRQGEATHSCMDKEQCRCDCTEGSYMRQIILVSYQKHAVYRHHSAIIRSALLERAWEDHSLHFSGNCYRQDRFRLRSVFGTKKQFTRPPRDHGTSTLRKDRRYTFGSEEGRNGKGRLPKFWRLLGHSHA